MRFMRSLALTALMLGCCALVLAADDWSLLTGGKFMEARTAFTATLKQRPLDARALLGLALLNDLEDSPLAALEAWRNYYQAAPADWPALAYWPRVVELARETGRYDHLEAIARIVLAAKGAPPELCASARLALADVANRAGKYAVADKEWASMGYLRAWRVIGPFDNVSTSGHEKTYPPETEINLGKSYPGINEIVLSWQPAGVMSREGICHIGDNLGDDNESVFYAVTAVFSPDAQPASLGFDPSGASKIYLNGKLILANDQYGDAQPLVADIFRVPVELRKGWNTVLVKIASDEYVTAAFRLRFTRPSGEVLPGFQENSEHVESFTVETPATVTSTEPAVAALLRQQPSNPEVAAALGYQLRLAGDYEASRDVLRMALANAPECGWLYWELSLTLQEDEQYDEAREAREQARKYAEHIVAAQLDFLQEEEESLDSNEYLARLKALVVQHPASPELHWTLSDAYDNADMSKESLAEARIAAQVAGGPDNLIRLVGTYQYQEMYADAEKVLTNALRVSPGSIELLTYRANQLTEQERADEAIPLFQRLMQAEGPTPQTRRRLAELYRSRNDHRQAIAMLEAIRAQCPQNAYDCVTLADLLREQDRTEDAVALYREAIRLDPSRVELREKLQVIAHEEPIINLAPATPAEPILKAAAELKGAPGVDAQILLDEMRQVVYPDYATLARCHIIVKVFNKAGVSAFETISLPVMTGSANATVEKARLIKPDGKIQDMTDESYGEISLPSLAPGDIIDATYRIEDYHTGALARQFWGEWYFSTEAPVSLSRYVLITPSQVSYTTREHRQIPQPTVSEDKGWRISEWRMTDVPSQRDEPLSPGQREIAYWLDISTVASWSDIVGWYRDLAGPRCVPDAAVRAKAEELTKDAKTDEEKLRALANFVSREISYQSLPFRMSQYIPTQGKNVLRDRYGDCKDKAALLSAMLSVVGIKSDLALVCGGRSESTIPYLPSPRFDHVINRVHLPSGPMWIDTTADQMAYGVLITEEQGVPMLVVADGITEMTITPMLPVETNGGSADYTLALSEDGKLTGSLAVSFLGTMNWVVRSALQHIQEAQHDMVLRSVIAKLIPNVMFDNGAIERLDDIDVPLTLRFAFHGDHYAAGTDNLLLVRLPWQNDMAQLESALNDPKRAHDIELGPMRGRQHATIRLTLPDGYVLQDLKPRVEGTSPWGSYLFTYRMEGNVLHAEWDMAITAARIPVADLPAFRDFLRAMGKEVARQVVLKK